jgi:hypothetical protein
MVDQVRRCLRHAAGPARGAKAAPLAREGDQLVVAADEVIQAVGLVMASKGNWRQVREALPVHPTVTELLPTIIDRGKPLAAA